MTHESTRRPWRTLMLGRDRHEKHRAATPLELLFDLCFVVAIAQAAAGLHHAIAEQHYAHGVFGFVQSFFAIWWAWMNFTWFASAYDTDDISFRLLGLLQITGALVAAAGVPRFFAGESHVTMTLGYGIMRVGLITCWLRAGFDDADPGRRRTARRYAFGVSLCQVCWIALLFAPNEVWMWSWIVLLPAELLVPAWAERSGATPWHPHHIIERYQLMTLIVIGESVLSATVALQVAIDAGHLSWSLGAVIAGAVLILFSAWWIYFAHPNHHVRENTRGTFLWGYGHYIVFASLAAVGAGIAGATDIVVSTHSHAPLWHANLVVTIPAAIFLTMVWILCVRLAGRSRLDVVYLLGIALLIGSAWVPLPVLPAGVVLALIAALTERLGGSPRAGAL